MIGVIARKLFGSSNERRIKSYQPRVAAINAGVKIAMVVHKISGADEDSFFK